MVYPELEKMEKTPILPSNKLIHEKSPYLLQHAHNPVNWYPWVAEAFEKAKEFDKPIFLSIGYSTCHWCHVMEKESFEDSDIAKMMNDVFISIKVDREERPDIDNIYMTVCQVMTGSGGWPLTLILTPDKKPFFAATYIPKESRMGIIGMKKLIPQIKSMWATKREEIEDISNQILQSIEKIESLGSTDSDSIQIKEITSSRKEICEILDKAYDHFLNIYDEEYGGFGAKKANYAPKFPSAQNLMFLLRYWKRYSDKGENRNVKRAKKSLKMVLKTLDGMRLGGIYDHIGFGFHRYSTDAKWLLPHFEKMLYDQAMNAMAYTEAYQITKKDVCMRTAKEVITYVLRDMTDKEGGFYSAEDADSEGEEGKFYLWTEKELKDLLKDFPKEIVDLNVFNILPDGNFRDESTGTKRGVNIPHMKKFLEGDELAKKVEEIRRKLFAEREKRVHPLKDDKILTDWNGLMIAALSKASRVFGSENKNTFDDEYIAAAEKCVRFILNNLYNDGILLHRFREGESAVPGFLDDYSFFTWGLIELYQTTFDTFYLKKALELTNDMIDLFLDKNTNSGFFFTSKHHETIIRKKEVYDGAYPSGNSVAILNLIRLAHITGDVNTNYEKIALNSIEGLIDEVRRSPAGFSQLLIAIDFLISPYEVVIVGEEENTKTLEMLNFLKKEFIPNMVVLLKTNGNEVERFAPFVRDLTAIEGKTTAYVCKNYKCSLPATSLSEVKEILDIG